jgi:hypothetical protein
MVDRQHAVCCWAGCCHAACTTCTSNLIHQDTGSCQQQATGTDNLPDCNREPHGPTACESAGVQGLHAFTIPPSVQGAGFAIWTTTPWTIPANLAVAVNGSLTYALVAAQVCGTNCPLAAGGTVGSSVCG